MYMCVFRLQERLKAKRLEKEAEERKAEIQREKQRRTFGKDVVSSKERFVILLLCTYSHIIIMLYCLKKRSKRVLQFFLCLRLSVHLFARLSAGFLKLVFLTVTKLNEYFGLQFHDFPHLLDTHNVSASG